MRAALSEIVFFYPIESLAQKNALTVTALLFHPTTNGNRLPENLVGQIHKTKLSKINEY
jgi:hypothetical protein